jgi:tyrosine-protein phosphatase SIW14
MTEPTPTPEKRRTRFARRVVLAVLVLAALPLGNKLFWRYHLKRFQAVRPGVFYRVAQPTEFGLRYLIKSQGIKTVLSFQLYDVRLRHGLFDPGEPSGKKEADYVAELGAQYIQWPFGDESYWPWLTPWQFDEFYRLCDNPANLPIVVHCAGGRHRTGTLAALFRLEYDRWPVEQVLAEMHAFDFGEPQPIQEHNLRTYLPRPRPTEAEWETLATDLGSAVADPAPANYEELVRRLRQSRKAPAVEQAVTSYLDRARPFAVCLAQRLIDAPGDPLAMRAARLAAESLEHPDASAGDRAMAAALVADFGTPAEQARLLELLQQEARGKVPSPRYRALVAGVTNRYTPNRVAYLRPLLEDPRPRAEAAAKYRYCDTAVVRLASITNENPFDWRRPMDLAARDLGRQKAREWFTAHPEEAVLSRLRSPTGKNLVRVDRESGEEDLGRLRR